jgi:hypothetical protein
VRTDSAGQAVLNLAPVGPLRLAVDHPGFEARAAEVALPEGRGLVVELSLARLPTRRRDE